MLMDSHKIHQHGLECGREEDRASGRRLAEDGKLDSHWFIACVEKLYDSWSGCD
jgi:hypothetical protein